MTTEFEIVREDENGEEQEITAILEWQYHKAHRGQRDSLGGKPGAGPPLEPDEPEELEFCGATDEDGKEIDLTDRELAEAEVKAWQMMERGHD